ncbi:DNA/RNA nuclease SfsA [Thalassotalea aquiviva]|uniref:DNA/RNA nuclease SfsA n=1 Tax=Thalassotalea aquiviva TaxID=3242415 RepID=UPI00352B605F
MKYPQALKKATLIKRYKRFLADVIIADGSEVTIHVANTGAMTGCAEPNDIVWFSTSDNPKRKYTRSWELTQTKRQHFICVNTIRANQLVEEALRDNTISQLQGYKTLKREVKYGIENSKIDFLLADGPTDNAYIEVKSVTLLDDSSENGTGYFPDTVTLRGQKHIRELIEIKKSGKRAVLLFAVLHTGIDQVKPARHIDPKYGLLIDQALAVGVEIYAFKANINQAEIRLNQMIPFTP